MPDIICATPLYEFLRQCDASALERVVLDCGAGVLQANNVWLELHCELAELSSNNIHLFAEESGHYIHHDQPGLVVDVIRQMVESAQ